MTRIIKDFSFEGLEFQFDYFFTGADGDYEIDVTGNTDAAQQALEDDEFYDRIYAHVNKTWFPDNKTFVEA